MPCPQGGLDPRSLSYSPPVLRCPAPPTKPSSCPSVRKGEETGAERAGGASCMLSRSGVAPLNRLPRLSPSASLAARGSHFTCGLNEPSPTVRRREKGGVEGGCPLSGCQASACTPARDQPGCRKVTPSPVGHRLPTSNPSCPGKGRCHLDQGNSLVLSLPFTTVGETAGTVEAGRDREGNQAAPHRLFEGSGGSHTRHPPAGGGSSCSSCSSRGRCVGCP